MLQFANLITDPAGAGKEFTNSALDTLWQRMAIGSLNLLDSAAFIAAFIGMFLFMLGIKKGGKITWVSLAVWFTVRAVLVSF